MAVITKTQLENASRDADDLALIVNGAADRPNPGQANGTVTTRLGQVVRTVARVIQDLAGSDVGESAAAAINQRITNTGFHAGPIGERGPTPFQDYENGLHWFTTDTTPPRLFTYIKAGNPDPSGTVVTSNTWFGYYTQAELKNLAIGFTNFLPQANVAGLADVFALYDAKALDARVSDLRARALNTNTPLDVAIDWSAGGALDRFELSWNNYTVTLGGGVRSFRPPNWSTQTNVTAIGDSMMEGKWVEGAAATLGLTLNNVSKYSSGAYQPYRLGTRQLLFTVTGNAIPASGTGVAITAINGGAPTFNNDDDPFSGRHFLNTSPGDTISSNCSVSGWYGGRHGVVSIPNGGSLSYTFTPDDGRGASTVAAQSIFVPDNLARLSTDELWIRMSQNYFYADYTPVFPNNINPRVLDDIQAIVDQARGQRIIILALTPGNDFLPGTKIYDALRYFNNQLRVRWPQYAAYLTGATYNSTSFTGNNMDFIRQFGRDGSANDQADYDNGLLPRSCVADGLHLNAKGQGLERDFMLLYRAAQAVPPTLALNTLVNIKAYASNARLGTTSTAQASTTVVVGVETTELNNQLINRPRLEAFEFIPSSSADVNVTNPPLLLDASGNVILRRTDPAVLSTVNANTANIAGNTSAIATKPSLELFEYMATSADNANPPFFVDKDGAVVLRRTDPAIVSRIVTNETNIANLTALIGPGPVSVEAFETIGSTGTTSLAPLVIDNTGKILLYANDPTAINTLTASIASLSARMDTYHDPLGAPAVQIYQHWRLRKARMKMRKLQLAVPNIQWSLTFAGDSYIDDQNKGFKKVADALYAKYGRAAVGYVGFATSVQLVGYRDALATGVTIVDGTATSPDTYSITSSTVGLVGTWYLPSTEARPTSARMLWNGTADGVIRYRWYDTDTWKTLNVQGSGVQSALLDLTGMPAAGTQIRLRIEVVSGSVDLYGVYYGNTAGVGVILNKCGNNGTRAYEWAALNQAQWVTAMSLIPTDTMCFLMLTNDKSDNRTADQIGTDMTTLMTRARLANPASGGVPGCDLFMILPPDIPPHYPTRMVTPYLQKMRALGPGLDCAVAAMNYSFGSDATLYSAWFDGAEGGSGYHPSSADGSYLYADCVLQAFSI